MFVIQKDSRRKWNIPEVCRRKLILRSLSKLTKSLGTLSLIFRDEKVRKHFQQNIENRSTLGITLLFQQKNHYI